MKKKIIFIVCLILSFAFCLFAACTPTSSSTEYDHIKKTKMENFTQQNCSAKRGQCVFIGDSIIEIYPVAEYFSDLGVEVYNRGISGDTSDRLSERLYDNALNILPSVLCILVGTNDLAKNIAVERVEDNFRSMISQCKEKSPQTKVVIMSVLPVNHSVDYNAAGTRSNYVIKRLNEKLKVLAEQENSVYYTDLYKAMLDDTKQLYAAYTYDGLHPKAEGYNVISDLMRPLLKQLLQ